MKADETADHPAVGPNAITAQTVTEERGRVKRKETVVKTINIMSF